MQVVYSTDLAALERVATLPLARRAYHKQGGPDPVELAAQEAAAAEPGMPMRCGGALRSSGSKGTAADVIALRILLDGSCLEVFTSTGEALGTRVYRGDEVAAQQMHPLSIAQHGAEAALGLGDPTAVAMAAAAAAGAVGWEELFAQGSSAVTNGTLAATALAGGELELVSFGAGPATLVSGSAWQMSSMWQQQQVNVAAVQVLPVPAATAVTAAAAEVLQGLMVAEAAAMTAAAAVAPVVLPVGELSLDMGAVIGGSSAAELLPLSPSAMGSVRPVQVEA